MILSLLALLALSDAPAAPTDLEAMRGAAKAWEECVMREADPMAIKTTETAETVARAAMSFCIEDEEHMLAVTELYLDGEGQAIDEAPGMVKRAKDAFRERLVNAIIKVRAQQP